MTLKVDGTNGVLQAYDYQVLTTGFSYTFAAGTQTLVINPAGTLATGTVTMPASPADGMVITVESTQQITALTIAANTGQTMVGGTVTLRQNQPLSFMYRLSNTTWYPFAGASNSQIVSGTAVASTSGTAIDYTGIPSWVKRITVMWAGLSTNGGSNLLVRLGTGSGIETTGYACGGAYTGASSSGITTTVGFLMHYGLGAGDLGHGSMTINLVNAASYIWEANATAGFSTSNYTSLSGGSKTLGGVLTQVRITSQGPDTFDAGTVNIFYE